jgi:rubrerythrin
MTTFVGNQELFVDALIELVELEYAAAEAYTEAIKNLKNPGYKQKLQDFEKDHLRHIDELSSVLKKHNAEVPTASSFGKEMLVKGKTFLASLIGDDQILSAMLSNELDTNTAYAKMTSRKDQWEETEDILHKAFQDEKRHKEWLESPC